MGMRFYNKIMVSVKSRCLGLVYIQFCVNLERDRVDKTKGNWELNFVIKLSVDMEVPYSTWVDNILVKIISYGCIYLYLVFTMKSLQTHAIRNLSHGCIIWIYSEKSTVTCNQKFKYILLWRSAMLYLNNIGRYIYHLFIFVTENIFILPIPSIVGIRT